MLKRHSTKMYSETSIINHAAFRTDIVHCEMVGVEQKELSKLIENPSILRPKGDQTLTAANIHSMYRKLY